VIASRKTQKFWRERKKKKECLTKNIAMPPSQINITDQIGNSPVETGKTEKVEKEVMTEPTANGVEEERDTIREAQTPNLLIPTNIHSTVNISHLVNLLKASNPKAIIILLP
jgi:hypothetical protein